MLLLENNIIEKLKEKPEFDEISNLKCYAKHEPDFNMYFFTYYVDQSDLLAEIEETVRDFIAIYFQGLTIEKDVERWNLYIFYFVNGNVKQDLKYKIEQDKFSTRKIVIDKIEDEPDDEKISELINCELFANVFTEPNLSSEENDKLEDLEQNYQGIIDFINRKGNSKPKDNIIELIETFGNE
jgi:hypothetical protein